MGVSTNVGYSWNIHSIFTKHSQDIHMYRVCVAYVSGMYRVCIVTNS